MKWAIAIGLFFVINGYLYWDESVMKPEFYPHDIRRGDPPLMDTITIPKYQYPKPVDQGNDTLDLDDLDIDKYLDR